MIILWIAAALCVVALIATWIAAFVDMSKRKDMSFIQIVLWVAAIVLFPLLGVLAYMLFRPSADKIQYNGDPPL